MLHNAAVISHEYLDKQNHDLIKKIQCERIQFKDYKKWGLWRAKKKRSILPLRIDSWFVLNRFEVAKSKQVNGLTSNVSIDFVVDQYFNAVGNV